MKYREICKSKLRLRPSKQRSTLTQLNSETLTSYQRLA